MTKKLFFLILLLGTALSSNFGQTFAKSTHTQSAFSPDGKIEAIFLLSDKGDASYKIMYMGKKLIGSSRLGLKLRDHDLFKGLNWVGIDTATVKETWKPVWGEVDKITSHYNRLSIQLVSHDGIQFNIQFRVFNDGVGFRYELPAENFIQKTEVMDEFTEFQLNGDLQAWWAPSDWDNNEHTYTHSKVSEIDATKHLTDIEPFNQYIPNVHAVQTPITLQAMDAYISIAEAATADYGALQLTLDRAALKFRSLVIPTADSTVKSVNLLPFNTPWRAILVSPNAAGLLTNRLILNLNEPCKIEGDLSWIKPQKYVGVWWELHVGKTAWNYRDKQGNPTGKHGANTANVKRYIDFAAANGFAGVLVEGWFEGWEDWFDVKRPEIFNFTKPYPDFDMAEISRYCKEKGVKIIVHQETGAAIPSFERQMDSSFAYIKQNGFNAIKTGYVGHVIPTGEWHDGQFMINHYTEVLRRAAQNQIMVCAHEPVRPSGLHRTWPNFMACEAARGMEYNAWSKGNDPSHELTLIFTRLLGGPMDYTPGIFQIEVNQFDPAKKERVHTTVAKQLALYVTLYSPLQMAADLPENYEKRMDVFQFIRDVPTDWSETRILNAEIGDFVTTARRKKNSRDWFVGSMTDETPRQFTLALDFLEDGRIYEAAIYEDGKDADYKTNPYPVNIRKLKVIKGQKLGIKLASGGGCAISLKELK